MVVPADYDPLWSDGLLRAQIHAQKCFIRLGYAALSPHVQIEFSHELGDYILGQARIVGQRHYGVWAAHQLRIRLCGHYWFCESAEPQRHYIVAHEVCHVVVHCLLGGEVSWHGDEWLAHVRALKELAPSGVLRSWTH